MVRNELEETGQYSVRIRKGDWEIEVSAPEKDFVLTESDRLIDLLALSAANTDTSEAENISQRAVSYTEPGPSRNIKPQTLNEFVRQFKLQTHLERILVLGYWCEIRQGQPSFTPDDILAKYREIREQPPANLRRDLGSLQGKGLLLSAGKSEEGLSYALTNTGIKEVESKMLQQLA